MWGRALPLPYCPPARMGALLSLNREENAGRVELVTCKTTLPRVSKVQSNRHSHPTGLHCFSSTYGWNFCPRLTQIGVFSMDKVKPHVRYINILRNHYMCGAKWASESLRALIRFALLYFRKAFSQKNKKIKNPSRTIKM